MLNTFTVVIPKDARNGTRKDLYMLGVTSICPNMNGVLFQCENRRGKQVEQYEMNVLNTEGRIIPQMSIWYANDSEIEGILLAEKNHPDWTEVHDGRA